MRSSGKPHEAKVPPGARIQHPGKFKLFVQLRLTIRNNIFLWVYNIIDCITERSLHRRILSIPSHPSPARSASAGAEAGDRLLWTPTASPPVATLTLPARWPALYLLRLLMALALIPGLVCRSGVISISLSLSLSLSPIGHGRRWLFESTREPTLSWPILTDR